MVAPLANGQHQIVVLAAVPREEGAEVGGRIGGVVRLQEEGNDDAAHAAVAFAEGVNRLELIVHKGDAREAYQGPLFRREVDVALEVRNELGHEARWGRSTIHRDSGAA